MSNLSAEWQAMAKLVSQFYAKADAGEFLYRMLLQICAGHEIVVFVVGI